MVREFKLPDVGEGVAEGELVRWLVAEGDAVTEDQPVAEVETDKAQVETPSPVDGTVQTLHWEEGDVIPVGSVFVTFAVDGEDEGATADAGGEAAPSAGGSDAADGADSEGAAATADGEAASSSTTGTRTFAPPSVRRLARELDVTLDAVAGSGPSGRVTERDVRAAAAGDPDPETGSEPDAADSPAGAATGPSTRERPTGGATPTRRPAGRDRTLAVPAARRVARDLDVDIDDVPTDERRDGEAFVTAGAVRDYAAGEADGASDVSGNATGPSGSGASAGNGEGVSETTRPYRGIRRTIGEQMARSKYTAPHATHHDTVVVDDLVETRARLRERAAAEDVALTYMPFVMKAVVAGLKAYPELNSELREDEGEIAIKGDYNLGVAVATDDGLMVPVVEAVDRKSMLELAREVDDLVARARDRSITREEMQGGTFTITNFGAIGGEYATPIINYPETAILGLGELTERPVVEDGDLRAAHTLPLSLAIDHRVVDGAEGAGFANTVMEHLHHPDLLLLG